MSERRMFSKSITESDAFLDLPLSAQALYFHLSMNADDEGFINSSKRIRNMCGAGNEDMQILIDRSFIISFDSGIVVIKHWKINNKLRKDRARGTNYSEEKAMLVEKNNGIYSEYKTDITGENKELEVEEKNPGIQDESVSGEEKQENYNEEKLADCVKSDSNKNCSEQIFDLYFSHGLPCANNIISFEMRDFKLAQVAIRNLNLSDDEIISAVKNYIEVVELKRKGLTWWNSEQSFNSFCEKGTIMKFLPGYFKLEDFYKDKSSTDKKALENKIQL